MSIRNLIYLLFAILSISLIWGLAVSGSGGEIEGTKGDGGPRFGLGGCYFGDSADFVHRSGHILAGFRFTQDMSLGAEYTRHWVSQESDELTGGGVGLQLEDTFGPSWKGKVGVGVTSYEEMGTHFSYLASLAFPPTETSHLTLSYTHDNVVHKVKSLAALEADIESDEFNPSFYQWISERWSFWGQSNLGRYSDGNLRTSADASLTYLLKADPRLSLSYGFGYLTYKERSDDYWDPANYVGHHLILVLNEGIGDLLSFNLTGTVGFAPSEKKVSPGFSARLTLHHSPHLSLEATGQLQGDPGRGDDYSSTTSSVNLAWLP